MDAPEDDLDVKLQRISSDLLGDFDRSLPALLRKSNGSVRTRATWRETGRLTSSVSTYR